MIWFPNPSHLRMDEVPNKSSDTCTSKALIMSSTLCVSHVLYRIVLSKPQLCFLYLRIISMLL